MASQDKDKTEQALEKKNKSEIEKAATKDNLPTKKSTLTPEDCVIAVKIFKGKEKNIKISDQSEQLSLFQPDPILEEINALDLNSVSPIDALNKLFEWQEKSKEN